MTSATSSAELKPSARKLTEMVMQTQRHCMPHFSARLHEKKLNYAQFYLLGVLKEGRELTMGEIAKRMGHSTAAATGLVDRLEKLSFVSRVASQEDRRRVVVAITSHGEKVVTALSESMVESVAELMASGTLPVA